MVLVPVRVKVGVKGKIRVGVKGRVRVRVKTGLGLSLGFRRRVKVSAKLYALRWWCHPQVDRRC